MCKQDGYINGLAELIWELEIQNLRLLLDFIESESAFEWDPPGDSHAH